MAKRLVKIAKELNVGTATIVEHLNKSGFDIDNKPSAKITEEMHAELLKEFKSSISVKEQADQLKIGHQKTVEKEKKKKEEEEIARKKELEEKEKARKERAKEEEAKKKEEEEAAKEEKVKEEEAKEESSRRIKGPKVVGKIDLDQEKKKREESKKKKEKETEEAKKPKEEETEKAKKKEKEVKEEAEEVVEGEATTDEEKPSEKEGQDKKSKSEDELVKAKAPQLKGLKVQGKIDLKKFEKKKKTKKEGEKDEAGSTKKRRRRRRKVVNVKNKNTRSTSRRGAGKKGSRKDEKQEVSQKEIEEKIKATMARISGGGGGGGKSKRSRSRKENRERTKEKEESQLQEEVTSSTLEVTEFISVSDLANLMDVSSTDIITTCMNLGVIVSINQRLDAEIIELVASEFDYEVEFISAEESTDEEDIFDDDPEEMVERSPIITVMGHVDHGKTSLLDYIRKESVASGEAGGITQHIGAYEVVSEDGRKITFLDTPGHEAFTAMRARGAKVTDVAIIIIAADDRIMPQTKEAISHAEAAGVPMVFAINKIDKPGADPERIKNELAQMNYLVEDWGGKYQSQDISAKTGDGIDELLEKILLESEVLELKANPDREAVGAVLEASLDKGRGYVTKVLIQTGTLRIGDSTVAGEHSGKIKAMYNERGERIEEAGPSQPVLILGLSGAPQAGERIKVMDSEQEARQLASKRGQIVREQTNRATKRISLDEIGRRLALGTFKELNLIVKGDVDGSVEALSDSLIELSQETVQVNVIHKAVGQIIESDVLLASASDAIIIGFQVRPSGNARKLAETEGVEIKTYSIIYEAIEVVKSAIEGMLEPTREEKITSQLDVREVFKITKVGTIAGCYVQEGKITRNDRVRIIRDGIVIYPTKEGVVGEIDSLKRFKDDVKEVRSGMECGISIKNFNDIKVGDIIEGYEIIEIKQTLE